MAVKKKKKPARPRVKAKAKAKAKTTATATRASIDLTAQIRSLESRLRALESNPVLALRDVLAVDSGAACRTVTVTGNLQIVNGMGRTNTTNGCGNLIIGYNEPPSAASGWPGTRTGSHNVILGRFHSHASYAGLLAGEMNRTTAAAPSSCVVGGSEGAVNGDRSVIVGGHEGKANSDRCVVLGGFDNGSNGANLSVVIGGTNNRAEAGSSSIFGGSANTTNAAAGGSTILGGTGLATNAPGERIPP